MTPIGQDKVAIKQQARDAFQANRPEQARGLLLRAVESSGADAELWFLLGVANGMTGDAAAAEQCFRRALDIKPNDPQALYNLGRSLRETFNNISAFSGGRTFQELFNHDPI